jgi:hypothetical protein
MFIKLMTPSKQARVAILISNKVDIKCKLEGTKKVIS